MTAITPEQMAALMQMARDIYPHDRVADEFYAIAVKGYDTAEQAIEIAEGVAALDAAAVAAGHASYVGIGWENDRVALLRGMETTPFFQKIRGGLVTGLYNQKASGRCLAMRAKVSARAAISTVALTTLLGCEGDKNHGCEI